MSALFAIIMISSLTMMLWWAPTEILSTALEASSDGVQLSIRLVAIFIFWMGIMQIATDSGLIKALAKLMRPIMRWLFGKQTEEVNGLLATNISANMIGAGNAATPAAIDAIEKMSKSNQTRATAPMIMLFVISATSMQLLPTTVIGILEAHGAENAHAIILPTFIVSTITTLIGVLMVRYWFGRKEYKKEDGGET